MPVLQDHPSILLKRSFLARFASVGRDFLDLDHGLSHQSHPFHFISSGSAENLYLQRCYA